MWILWYKCDNIDEPTQYTVISATVVSSHCQLYVCVAYIMHEWWCRRWISTIARWLFFVYFILFTLAFVNCVATFLQDVVYSVNDVRYCSMDCECNKNLFVLQIRCHFHLSSHRFSFGMALSRKLVDEWWCSWQKKTKIRNLTEYFVESKHKLVIYEFFILNASKLKRQ